MVNSKKTSLPKKITNFYKRWNIDYNTDKMFIDFKNRTLSTIDNILGEKFLSNNELERSYLKIIAKYFPQSKIIIPRSISAISAQISKMTSEISIKELKFSDSTVYKFFLEENDFVKYIYYLQVLFWLDLDSGIKEKLYYGFKEDIDFSLLDIKIVKIKEDNFIIYPKGARLLDEKLINDVLGWLSSYPKAQNNFISALEKYQNKHYTRNLIDDLRLSLEFLLKLIFSNKKSLENQKNALFEYLDKKKVPVELKNMYWKILDYYNNYQNNYAKHEDKINSSEVEFVIYLTGTFMRFLITLEAI